MIMMEKSLSAIGKMKNKLSVLTVAFLIYPITDASVVVSGTRFLMLRLDTVPVSP